MAACPRCRISSRTISRIPDDIVENCHKNRVGICFACQKLINIDRKIEDARRTLESLLDEREELTAVLNEHHDPFAHRLPVEIASRVFLHCKPDMSAAYTSPIQQEEKVLIAGVLSPGRICKSWRRIARGTAGLWTVLCATISPTNCISSVAIIQDWLNRSSGLPLFIQLIVDGSSTDVFVPATQKILTSIIHHAHRAEVLDLSIPSAFLSKVATASFDRLDHLKLEVRGQGSIVLHLNASPRLLTLYSPSLHVASATICQQLTRVVAECLSIDDAAQLLRSAPRLTFCKISQFQGPQALLPTAPVICPSLQTLVVGIFPDYLWDILTLPVIENLCIQYPEHDNWTRWANLQHLLRRSKCKLQKLSIEDSEDSHGELLPLLRLAPDLKHLSLDGEMICPSLFREMDSAATVGTLPSSPKFLQKIESLRCATDDVTFDWSGLVSLLTTMSSRQERSLQDFEFQYNEQFSEDMHCAHLPKIMFKHVIDAVHGLNFTLRDGYGGDLGETLRCRYQL